MVPQPCNPRLGSYYQALFQHKQHVHSPLYVCFLSTVHKEEDTLLERFWSIESMGVELPEENSINSEFLSKYQSTIQRTPDGGYTAKLPWRNDHPPLPTNKAVSDARTRSMLRRLEKDPNALQQYDKVIRDQEERGFIERVPESSPPLKQSHYIPHHPIWKASSTTPLRIVYDCSCHQSSDSPSLNDCLQVGPPLQNDLCSILLRFRTPPIAISTDIEKAFLHVGLNEADRNYTRFFWLSDPNNPRSPFQTYRFSDTVRLVKLAVHSERHPPASSLPLQHTCCQRHER